MKCVFGFLAWLIGYALNFGISSKTVVVLVVGLIFAVIYYFMFLFAIKRFDILTLGRGEEETSNLSKLNNDGFTKKAWEIPEAIGNKENIEVIGVCITRIRLTVKDGSKIQEYKLKEIGATGVMKLNEKNYQIVVGTSPDPLVTHMKTLIK